MSGADGSAGSSPAASSSIRDTLLNKWWRNPNEKSPSSPSAESPSDFLSVERPPRDSKSPARRLRSPYRRKKYPPRPIVEDAAESLAKEYAAGNHSDSAYESGEEPQVRGSIDQQPIILDAVDPVSSGSSDGSGDESFGTARDRPVNKSNNARPAEHYKPSKNVLPDYESKPASKTQGGQEKRRDDLRGKPRERLHERGNEQRKKPDVPPLNTELEEPPRLYERRAASPYTFTPTRAPRETASRTPLEEHFLSPESYHAPKFAGTRRSGSYTLSRDALQGLQNDEKISSNREKDHNERGRSTKHLSVNADQRSSHSMDPGSTRRWERRRSSSAEPALPAAIRPEQFARRPESGASTPRRESRAPGRIVLPDRGPFVSPKIDYSSEESEYERPRHRPRRNRTPLVTPDGQRVPSQEESYFTLPKPSHRRHDSGTHHRADTKRLEELKSAEFPLRQPSSPTGRSRPSTPSLHSGHGPVTPGVGSSSFPRSDSLPSSTGSSSRTGSRPGSSAGSTPPSPGSPLHHSSSTPIHVDPSRSSRPSADSANRGRRAGLDELSYPEPSVTPRPGPHQGGRSSTFPTQHVAPSSVPSTLPNDFLAVRPRLDVASSGQTRRSHSYAPDRDARPSSPHASPRPSPRSSRESSPTSLAREKLKVAPLPPCPRSQYTRGYNDWSSLVNFPDFNICPACLNGSFGSTPHRGYFVPAPPRPAGSEIKCDFSLPWIRVAWVLTLKQRKKTLELVYATARIASTFRPCPRASGAERQWHGVIHPDTGHPVSNFNVCPCCKESLEALLPQLRGVFVPTARPPHGSGRICDLRFDSKRFLGFVDELESTAKQCTRSSSGSSSMGIPDMRSFAKYAAKRVSLRECPGPDPTAGRGWHIITSMPEFTVCEECFHDDVVPAIGTGSGVANQFARRLQLVAPPDQTVVCRMASPRMKELWRQTIDRNDMEFLRRGVWEDVWGSR
ncbi:MAG: hypothetical protein M4579_004594 [Chaenotheca gracillima]|nr:MAG: hypothetical protein M4579_004594 [Chaenotheca gracillima]